MVFTVLCLSQMGHVLAIRSETESLFSQGLLSNRPLAGAFLLTLALLPLLRKGRGDAGVLFLGDAFAGELWPGYLPYCLSKLALPSLAAGLRKALPPGVRIGVVRPGLVLPPDRFPVKKWERLRAEKAGRRGLRTPEGVARAVLHFARAGNYNRRTNHHQGGVQ